MSFTFPASMLYFKSLLILGSVRFSWTFLNLLICFFSCAILSKVLMQGKLFQVYPSFVLQCRRLCKHKTDVEAWHGIHLSHKKSILVIGNYYVNYQNFQNSMILSSSDNKQTLIYLFLFTNSAQRELVAICT